MDFGKVENENISQVDFRLPPDAEGTGMILKKNKADLDYRSTKNNKWHFHRDLPEVILILDSEKNNNRNTVPTI